MISSAGYADMNCSNNSGTANGSTAAGHSQSYGSFGFVPPNPYKRTNSDQTNTTTTTNAHTDLSSGDVNATIGGNRRTSFGSSYYAPVKLAAESFETVELLNYIHMGYGAIGHSFGPGGAAAANAQGAVPPSQANTARNMLTTDSDKEGAAGGGEMQVHTNTQANSTKRKYFLKILSKAWVSAEGLRKHVLSEASILSTVSHMFMVHLFDRFQTANELVFAFEFLPGGDLFHLLYGHVPRLRYAFIFGEWHFVRCFDVIVRSQA
jgi:serine/threonine protein kinase